MKNFSITEQKNIEHLALNTSNVTDYGKDGLDLNNMPKDGFYQLRDKRVVRLAALTSANSKVSNKAYVNLDFDIEAAIQHHSQLKDLKGLGLDRITKKARSGFYISKTGKVVSLKQLTNAVNVAKKTTENITVNGHATIS